MKNNFKMWFFFNGILGGWDGIEHNIISGCNVLQEIETPHNGGCGYALHTYIVTN
jgi:hypothetical protein